MREVMPYIVIVVIVVFLRSFIITPIEVTGPSMQNSLQDGDIMFLDKITYHFHNVERFDIVVIKTSSRPIIKRVIGMPGEEINIIDGEVYINGQTIEEDFDYLKDNDNFDYEGKIPEGTYFVLGDNRSESLDSRVLGVIKEDSIIGKTNLVIWPIANIGLK